MSDNKKHKRRNGIREEDTLLHREDDEGIELSHDELLNNKLSR